MINKDIVLPIILDRIAAGESLRSILPQKERDKNLPALTTFLDWVSKDEVLSKQYARAMDAREFLIFEEMFEIADDAKNDYMTKRIAGQEVEVVNPEVVQRSRLRIDTRKWALSKMNPKKYGDKIESTNKNQTLDAEGNPVDPTKVVHIITIKKPE